uniref:ACB domain-containing protein n=1 Tax=viral metagenome TaxID=1070528 RepID=A0A6C0BV79_9ZZZZ
MELNLEQQFQDYVALIKTKDPLPSDSDLLILYGLYKQSTQGDCNTPQPWSIQLAARARWDAWYKNYGMDRNVAMEKYIEKVNELMDEQNGGQ